MCRQASSNSRIRVSSDLSAAGAADVGVGVGVVLVELVRPVRRGERQEEEQRAHRIMLPDHPGRLARKDVGAVGVIVQRDMLVDVPPVPLPAVHTADALFALLRRFRPPRERLRVVPVGMKTSGQNEEKENERPKTKRVLPKKTQVSPLAVVTGRGGSRRD